jgi:hypothetical protein
LDQVLSAECDDLEVNDEDCDDLEVDNDDEANLERHFSRNTIQTLENGTSKNLIN